MLKKATTKRPKKPSAKILGAGAANKAAKAIIKRNKEQEKQLASIMKDL